MLGAASSPRWAFVVAAFVACVWCNQGPSARRYDALAAASAEAPTSHWISRACLRAWLPLGFLYRRSADEELYFAVGRAIRGAPYDSKLLLQKRGESTAAFRRMPEPDGRFHMPYAEVPFEYPALVLPFILLPTALAPNFDGFAPLFGALMGACLLSALGLAIDAAPRRGEADRASAWLVGAGLVLAQGGLAIQRLDAIAAVFLALALWAAVQRRWALLGLAVGLAAAVKVTPIFVLVPLCAAAPETWRTRDGATRVLAGLGLGLALGFVPMLLASPRGFGDFLAYHAARGLQVESTYGTLFSIAEALAGDPAGTRFSFGSYNIDGPAAAFFAHASTWILLLAIAALGAWIARAARGPASEDERRHLLAVAALSGVTCIWLFGKVFSPQYLTWGIPLAAGLATRRVPITLGWTMVIAQVYLRGFYDFVVAMRPLGVAALTLRTAALVVLAVVLGRAIALSAARADAQAAARSALDRRRVAANPS